MDRFKEIFEKVEKSKCEIEEEIRKKKQEEVMQKEPKTIGYFS